MGSSIRVGAITSYYVSHANVLPHESEWQFGTTMSGGSLQLHEYPTELVRLSCEKCGRAGQYQKRNLVERYGADIRLPCAYYFFLAVVVIRYETTAAARWALLFIVRAFFNDTITVAVWTGFHVRLMGMLPHPAIIIRWCFAEAELANNFAREFSVS